MQNAIFVIFVSSMKIRKAILLSFIACAGLAGLTGISAQSRMTREEYILMYKDIAIEQMHRTGIPASITLAQACLESDNGNSPLATEANNHFGIKCHSWTRDSIHIDDDELQECFRKYDDAAESFQDHSDFLKYRKRYARLFDLDPYDYAGWARGLKAAGYATLPTYAEKLIKIIEENYLFLFDRLTPITPGLDSILIQIPAAPDSSYSHECKEERKEQQ